MIIKRQNSNQRTSLDFTYSPTEGLTLLIMFKKYSTIIFAYRAELATYFSQNDN